MCNSGMKNVGTSITDRLCFIHVSSTTVHACKGTGKRARGSWVAPAESKTARRQVQGKSWCWGAGQEPGPGGMVIPASCREALALASKGQLVS